MLENTFAATQLLPLDNNCDGSSSVAGIIPAAAEAVVVIVRVVEATTYLWHIAFQAAFHSECVTHINSLNPCPSSLCEILSWSTSHRREN